MLWSHLGQIVFLLSLCLFKILRQTGNCACREKREHDWKCGISVGHVCGVAVEAVTVWLKRVGSVTVHFEGSLFHGIFIVLRRLIILCYTRVVDREGTGAQQSKRRKVNTSYWLWDVCQTCAWGHGYLLPSSCAARRKNKTHVPAQSCVSTGDPYLVFVLLTSTALPHRFLSGYFSIFCNINPTQFVVVVQ